MLNQMGNGYSGATTISGGLRVDGTYYDPSLGKNVPVELKPFGSNLVRGWNQLNDYERAMQVPVNSGQLWTYSFNQNGALIFRRVF
jgi:Restriction endonuclease fold toxin 9